MSPFKRWSHPTFKELRCWARYTAKRWYHKYLSGVAQYGIGFKGDPILHAYDEVDDLNSYLRYADSRTAYRTTSVCSATQPTH